jgi:hypothetical protein
VNSKSKRKVLHHVRKVFHDRFWYGNNSREKTKCLFLTANPIALSNAIPNKPMDKNCLSSDDKEAACKAHHVRPTSYKKKWQFFFEFKS